MLPANTGVNYFIDWDNFRASFRKEFFPLHEEVTATNTLEGTAYFQANHSVDDYLDSFRDLISESGYTSPKTIVVKFWRGLDPEVGDAVATMTANRPDDLDPEAWYEAAIRIDQNKAMNAAFRGSVEAPSDNRPPPEVPTIPEDQPKIPEEETRLPDVASPPQVEPGVLDIKNMSADDVHNLLERLSTIQRVDRPPTPLPKKRCLPPPPRSFAHPPNRYQPLIVEDTPDATMSPLLVPEATCATRPRRPRWERRLPLTPEIGAAKLGWNSLYLQVEVESTGNQQKYGICALVDSGATGLFIDRECKGDCRVGSGSEPQI